MIEFRTLVAMMIYPQNLMRLEIDLDRRYPGWSHLLKPARWSTRTTKIALEIALDPPGDQWGQEDEEFFANNPCILSWQRLDAEEWLKAMKLEPAPVIVSEDEG